MLPLIVGGVVVLLVVVLSFAFSQGGSKPAPSNGNTGNASNPNSNQAALVSYSSSLDEMRLLFSNPATKQQALYEFTYTGYLTDTKKADKIETLRRILQQKAEQKDTNAKAILSELDQYATTSKQKQDELGKKSCDELVTDLFSANPAAVVKAPWQYDAKLQNLASVDYISDIAARENIVLHKKALSEKSDQGCKDVLALANKKAEELKKNDKFEPVPSKAEIVKNAARDLAGTDPVSNEKYKNPIAEGAPQVQFDNFQVATNNLPKPPSATLPIYQYYANLSYSDVEDLGKALGLKERARKRDPETYVIEEKNGALLEAKKLSGSFKYFSTDYWLLGQPVFGGKVETSSINAQKATDIALEFLKKNSLLSESSLKPQTYQKQGRPTLFVEIHTGDESSGMPPKLNGLQILNNIGSIAGEPAKFPDTANMARDPSIVNTSDNLDGYARPNDFNTITVEINKNEKIVSLEYNHRRLKRALPALALKSPEEALAELNQGKGILDFTLPSQDTPANVTQDQIFPKNKAVSHNVRVSDVFLAYIYKPLFFPQEYMVPAYMFRGETKLDSGYMVNYIVAVNAVKDNQ